MSDKLATLFPLPKLRGGHPYPNMVIHSGEISVEQFIDAFFPHGAPFTPDEVTHTPWCYAVDIDVNSMLPVRACAGESLRVSPNWDMKHVPATYIPRISVCYIKPGSRLIMGTSFWMPQQPLAQRAGRNTTS